MLSCHLDFTQKFTHYLFICGSKHHFLRQYNPSNRFPPGCPRGYSTPGLQASYFNRDTFFMLLVNVKHRGTCDEFAESEFSYYLVVYHCTPNFEDVRNLLEKFIHPSGSSGTASLFFY